MTERSYQMAVRDDLGNVYSGKRLRANAGSVIEAAMIFYNAWGEFPTEVLWSPDGLVRGREEKIHQLQSALIQLEDKYTSRLTQVKILEEKVRRAEEREGEWKKKYRLVRHYLDKVVVNTRAVQAKLEAEDPPDAVEETAKADRPGAMLFGITGAQRVAAAKGAAEGQEGGEEEEEGEDEWRDDDYQYDEDRYYDPDEDGAGT